MATFRLFVALELPDGVGEALASWSAASLGDHDGLRLVAPSALHLTLCFLGATPASAVEAVASACADVMAGRAPVAARLDN